MFAKVSTTKTNTCHKNIIKAISVYAYFGKRLCFSLHTIVSTCIVQLATQFGPNTSCACKDTSRSYSIQSLNKVSHIYIHCMTNYVSTYTATMSSHYMYMKLACLYKTIFRYPAIPKYVHTYNIHTLTQLTNVC